MQSAQKCSSNNCPLVVKFLLESFLSASEAIFLIPNNFFVKVSDIFHNLFQS